MACPEAIFDPASAHPDMLIGERQLRRPRLLTSIGPIAGTRNADIIQAALSDSAATQLRNSRDD
jgi:hypothetical protein